MSSTSKIALWIFGGVTLISLSYFIFSTYFPAKTPSSPGKIKDEPKPAKTEPEKKKVEVTVEDEDESEEEEEEEESEDEEEEEEEEEEEKEVEQLEVMGEKLSKPEAVSEEPTATPIPAAVPAESADEAARLKEQYEALTRMASKLINGQVFDKAADKLSEAIALAPKVPSAQRDLLTLYNNRSAVLEKLGRWEDSSRDIAVVLAMEANHLKARARRARVEEAQGKLKEALQDFVHATLLARARGEEATFDKKITELSKRLAADRTAATLREIRSGQAKRSLPSKAFCRNFFEAYPSHYTWRAAFLSQGDEPLLAYKTAKEAGHTGEQLLAAGLEAAKSLFSQEAFKRAFEIVRELPALSPEEEEGQSPSHRSLLSLLHELRGTEFHLLYQMEEALREYRRAVELSPDNLTAQLKRNVVLLENGDRDEALRSYESLLSHYSESVEGPEDRKTASRAWVFNHRASLWIARDEFGVWGPDALAKAIGDLDQSLNESANVMQLPEGKGAHFVALLKSVQLRTHTKQAMEQPTSEEDYAHNRVAIQGAKTLFPDHESVLLLEVEQLGMEGDTDGATKLVEKAKESGKYDEFIVVNLQATISTNLAFNAFQAAASTNNQELMFQAQALFSQVNQFYQRAIELDPESIEVKAQFAQLKSMMFGEIDAAISLLKDALAIARSRDEVQDILAMLISNEAQGAAITEIKKTNNNL